jgi:hypothetical protein
LDSNNILNDHDIEVLEKIRSWNQQSSSQFKTEEIEYWVEKAFSLGMLTNSPNLRAGLISELAALRVTNDKLLIMKTRAEMIVNLSCNSKQTSSMQSSADVFPNNSNPGGPFTPNSTPDSIPNTTTNSESGLLPEI